MIEIPKYSVPTYDPHALAPNQHTDFTRRIPTGFTQKQLDRDARIILQIVRAYDDGGPRAAEKVLDIFCRKAKLLTNPRYWEVMRTVWVAAGSTETAHIFRTMMKSKRPCRSWFMTPEDAQALDAMQFPLTVWRAYDPKYDTAAWQARMETGGRQSEESTGTGRKEPRSVSATEDRFRAGSLSPEEPLAMG